MSIFAINGFHFDAQAGVIRTLERDAKIYTTPASPHVGLQVLAPRGPEFQLILTRYAAASDRETLQRFFTSHIGTLVTIVDGPNQYIFPPWQLRFAVVNVQIQSAEVVPAAMTSRLGVDVSYSPAAVIVSTWTLHAIPANL